MFRATRHLNYQSLKYFAAPLHRFSSSTSRKSTFSSTAVGIASGLVGGCFLGSCAALANDTCSPSIASFVAMPGDRVASLEAAVDPLDGIGQYDDKLPTYTRAQIAEHKTANDRIWVSFRDGVYDITDFVASHPGGAKRIMLAAGSAVDPFWDIYEQHKASGPATYIKKALQQMRIGNVAKNEEAPVALDDPYVNEPEFGKGHRSSALNVHSKRAFNAEPPKELIGENYITPRGLFYCRHHHPVPTVDTEKYRLKVKGKGCSVNLSLSLDELKSLFEKQKVIITLQCAGNRRSGLDKIRSTQGLKWGAGAISTAEFGGVWLRDVLRLAGVEDVETAERAGAKHVQFTAIDKPYDASIPVEKACSRRGDVLLAYEMNGEELPREHGFPVRVLVPGHLGARSVKWLDTITVSDEEAYSSWQRGVAYRGFGPHVRHFDNVDVEQAHPVQELPVQSAITNFSDGDIIETERGEPITVSGYAWSGGGRKIVRVDVSADGGESWTAATLKAGSEQALGKAWAWTLWEADVVPSPVSDEKNQSSSSTGLPNSSTADDDTNSTDHEIQLCVKAVDESFNTQPERPEPIWNLRGILNNSWDRVNVILRES